jgi:ABC-type Fe3+-siderophore transport system permease subunit
VVLPGSALLGAALVVSADAVARTIVKPAELPLGVLTAFIGVPLFWPCCASSGARYECAPRGCPASNAAIWALA